MPGTFLRGTADGAGADQFAFYNLVRAIPPLDGDGANKFGAVAPFSDLFRDEARKDVVYDLGLGVKKWRKLTFLVT